MTLAEWMEANGVSDERLAEMLGMNRSTASRFRRGKLLPSRATLITLIKLTDGAVDPETFNAEAA